MSISEPDLNLLVALRALLEEANVTRAGERIGMGQSTMSSALARLRTVFHDELLVRIGRDYELTPLAHQLLPQVQVTLPLIARSLGQQKEFDPSLTDRRFSIQLTDYAALELRTLFGLVVASAPGVGIDLRKLPMAPTDSDRDMLTHDFVVAVPGIGIDGESIELFRDEYVVVADRSHPALASGSISIDDFLAYPHIRCDFGRAHVTPPERRMRELDLNPEVRVTTSTLLPIPSIVVGTDLIGVIPKRLAMRFDTTTAFVPAPFPSVELVERLWWYPAHLQDQGHTWFRGLVAEFVRAGATAGAAVSAAASTAPAN